MRYYQYSWSHHNVPQFYPVYTIQPLPTEQIMKPYHHQYRQFEEVDSSFFGESAKSMQILLKDASIVLTKLANSQVFAKKVMVAAQQSNMSEVEYLIKSTGIKSKVETNFNPDGINMKLSSKVGGTDCCHLTIALRWR